MEEQTNLFHESAQSCTGKRLRMLRITLLCLCALIIILLTAFGVIWHNEIAALLSIKRLSFPDEAHQDGSTYEMTVWGGYYFEDYLAQGGAATDAALISFITEHITKGLIPMNIRESNIGCSSFTATLEDGKQIFGRNYDFSRTNTCIIHTNPGKGRHASVSTIDLQFIGIEPDEDINGISDKILMLAAPYVPLDGLNDVGVACGIYMSYQGAETVATDQCTEKPDLTSSTMLRLILDYADSVDEAIALVSQYDLHDSANTSFHYMVADAQGNSAVLEWVNANATDSTDNDGTARALKVTRSSGTPFQTITNYILYTGYYDEEPEEEIKGLDRDAYLQTILSGTNGVVTDTEAAMKLLQAVGRRTWNKDGSSLTIHSVVYNLTDCTAIWVGNEHYGEEEYTYHLSVK